jgi:hypothetical protein
VPIICKFKDLAGLRDFGRPGPLTKLNDADDRACTIVDRMRITRLIKAIMPLLEEYEHAYLDLVRKYGTPRMPGGNIYDLPDGSKGKDDEEKARNGKLRAEFDAELDSLGNAECEINASPLPVETYGKLPLLPRDLLKLDPFLVPLIENEAPAAQS